MSHSTSPLNESRERINEIDEKILHLLGERRKVSIEVAKFKIHTQKPVRDIQREQMLLEKLVLDAKSHNLDSAYIIKIFQTIIQDSVQYQQLFLQNQANPENENTNTKAKVSFLGDIGSYSNLAARNYFSKRNNQLIEIQCKNFKDVIEHVENGIADYGVLPLENTTTGSINEVYDQLQHTNLSIIGEITQAIEHSLLVAVDTDLEHLQILYSHPQPQQQCSAFLDSFVDLKHQYCSSSTEAMKKVFALKSPNAAAIGNPISAEFHGLKALRFNIANQKENRTRFIVVARKPIQVTPLIPAKTTLIISTSQTPGSLMDCLFVLRNNGINMTKLESRPVPENAWEEMFYLDVEKNIDSKEMKDALEQLKKTTRNIKILGCYPMEDRA